MDNAIKANQKRADKKPKKKKAQQQPALKVVYITNPIKFKATASEFRALVQELTGQDAEVSDYSRFTAADGVGADRAEVAIASKGAMEGNAHAVEAEVGLGDGGVLVAAQKGSDLSATSGSYGGDDRFCSPEMMMIEDSFEGLADSSLWSDEDVHLDVFERL